MLTSVQDMANAKAFYEQTLVAYMDACVAHDWATVEKKRLEVVSALECTLDAVAMAHRCIEETKSHGR